MRKRKYRKFDKIYKKMLKGEQLTDDEVDETLRLKKKYNSNISCIIWYSQLFNLFEISKQLIFKEFVIQEIKKPENTMKTPFRWSSIRNVNQLRNMMINFNAVFRSFNFYASVDYYDTIHKMHVRGQKRKNDLAMWHKCYHEHITGADFMIDIDSNSITKSYEEAKLIFEFFKLYKLKFAVWCSGSKGFHFKIPFNEIKHHFKGITVKELHDKYKDILIALKDQLNLKYIDDSSVNLLRYLKVAYSIDYKTNRVILPLTDNQFKNFNVDMLDINTVLNNIRIKNRGLYRKFENGYNRGKDSDYGAFLDCLKIENGRL